MTSNVSKVMEKKKLGDGGYIPNSDSSADSEKSPVSDLVLANLGFRLGLFRARLDILDLTILLVRLFLGTHFRGLALALLGCFRLGTLLLVNGLFALFGLLDHFLGGFNHLGSFLGTRRLASGWQRHLDLGDSLLLVAAFGTLDGLFDDMDLDVFVILLCRLKNNSGLKFGALGNGGIAIGLLLFRGGLGLGASLAGRGRAFLGALGRADGSSAAARTSSRRGRGRRKVRQDLGNVKLGRCRDFALRRRVAAATRLRNGNLGRVEQGADPGGNAVLLGQCESLLGGNPDVASRLLMASSRQRLDVLALGFLVSGLGVGKGGLEHAGSRDVAVDASAHQEVAVGAALEDSRDDSLLHGGTKVSVVKDTERIRVDLFGSNHFRGKLGLAEATTRNEVGVCVCEI